MCLGKDFGDSLTCSGCFPGTFSMYLIRVDFMTPDIMRGAWF